MPKKKRNPEPFTVVEMAGGSFKHVVYYNGRGHRCELYLGHHHGRTNKQWKALAKERLAKMKVNSERQSARLKAEWAKKTPRTDAYEVKSLRVDQGRYIYFTYYDYWCRRPKEGYLHEQVKDELDAWRHVSKVLRQYKRKADKRVAAMKEANHG